MLLQPFGDHHSERHAAATLGGIVPAGCAQQGQLGPLPVKLR